DDREGGKADSDYRKAPNDWSKQVSGTDRMSFAKSADTGSGKGAGDSSLAIKGDTTNCPLAPREVVSKGAWSMDAASNCGSVTIGGSEQTSASPSGSLASSTSSSPS